MVPPENGRVSGKLGCGHGARGRNPSARFAGTSPFRGGFLVPAPPKEMPRAKRVLHPLRLPAPKHRPIVENGTFSTGPLVRNRREPRSGRPCEAPPTQAACLRGGPGAGAPHGNLAGPRQPLVPFPCGKGTRASADARNSLKQHPKPRPCAPHPRSQHRITKVLSQRQKRGN